MCSTRTQLVCTSRSCATTQKGALQSVAETEALLREQASQGGGVCGNRSTGLVNPPLEPCQTEPTVYFVCLVALALVSLFLVALELRTSDPVRTP